MMWQDRFKREKMKKLKVFIVALFSLTVLLPVVGSAQETNPGSSGLSISPTRFEFTIERGEADVAEIALKNVSDDNVTARVFLNDFEPDGTTGNPKLLIDDQQQSANSLREFVVGITDVDVAAGETVPVQIPIQIPEEAAPGAYYGAIRFVSVPEGQEENDDTQLALNASVAALLLVEVPGDLTEKIEINDLSAFVDGNSGSLFTKKPNEIGVTITNQGNGFSKPFGTVKMSGPWGRGEVFNYELNDTSPRGNVLPGATRLFLNGIEDGSISLPGRYSIEANISHGRGGEILTVSSSFWYLPAWFIIASLLVLIGIVGLAYYLYRKYVTKSTRRRK
jgi:hypothetical protein